MRVRYWIDISADFLILTVKTWWVSLLVRPEDVAAFETLAQWPFQGSDVTGVTGAELEACLTAPVLEEITIPDADLRTFIEFIGHG